MDGVIAPERPKVRAPVFRGCPAGGQIPQHVLRPDIDGLVLIALSGDRYPPFQVSGQGPVPQALPDISVRKGGGIFPPFGMCVHQGLELPLQTGDGDIEMLRFPEAHGLPAGRADRIHKGLRLQHRTAGVALIAPGLLPAPGTFPQQEAVCQKRAAALAIGLWGFLFVDILAIVQFSVEFRHKAPVLRRGGLRIHIIAEAQPLKAIRKFPMIEIADFPGRPVLLFCPDGHGRPVAVASGHEVHIVPRRPVVSGQYVPGQQPRDMSDVQGAVCVGPCPAD